jgi:uncharacterized protein
MFSPYEAVAQVVNRRPVLVAAVILCAIVVALVGTTFVSMETGSKTYLDENTERYILLNHYSNTYQTSSIMVLIEADNVLDPAVLKYIDTLERDIQAERYVSGTTSVAAMMTQANGGVLPSSAGEIAEARDLIPAEVLSRYVPSRMMTICVVMLEPGISEQMQFSLSDSINSRIGLSDVPPGVSVTLTGEIPFSQQMGAEMGTSMGILILAAMVLMVIAVGIFFGHVRYRLLSVAIVATGLIFTFGFIGWAGMQVSMAVIAAFPVLIGIGIDYAIQFHTRFDEEVRRTSVSEAVRTTITKAGPSVLYAMLATSMGFLALWISPLPMIRGFGIVCVIGVASCYLAALVIVPTFGVLFKYRPVVTPEESGKEKRFSAVNRYNQFIGDIVEKVARNPIPVLLLCAMIALVGFQMDATIPINTNEKTFVPSDMPAKVQLDKVSRTMGAMSGFPILIRGESVLSVDGVRWMAEFQQYVENHNDKITGSASIASYILQYNGGEMPASNQELQEVLERIPEDTKKRYINGNSEAVMEIFYVAMENQQGMSQVDLLIRDLAYKQPPAGIVATPTGMSEMFTNLIREISGGKTTMTLIGFGMILAFLFLAYRKFGRAATPLVPIAMIVGWNGLIMYVLGIDYTPMTATLGSMTIGVASEYTILIMERAYEERERGLALLPAVRQAVQKIGTAITISGLTTIFGFAALMLSEFGLISNFGMVTVISVGFALIGAIIVMPAILIIVGSVERAPRKAGDPVIP